MQDTTHTAQQATQSIQQARRAERRTLWVIALTAVTMVVELIAGTLTGSMALLADGWHMATHVGALSITAFAYYIARRHASDPRFAFGTGKVASLGGYTSAVALGAVAVLMAVESTQRLLNPQDVQFSEAMIVAWIGLIVNLVSAWLLHGGHDHHHGHGHAHHGHGHGHHHDHNLRAAYLHVIADALTSVLAIVALWAGARYGWIWLDPLMGIVGAIVISRWALGLLRETSATLLDAHDHTAQLEETRTLLESDVGTRVHSLRIWRSDANHLACIISLATEHPRPVDWYKNRLAEHLHLALVHIEIHHAQPAHCTPK